jgi:hypothetical protein
MSCRPCSSSLKTAGSPSEQCLAILRGLDALWAAIEESDPQRVFHVGDRARNGRL